MALASLTLRNFVRFKLVKCPDGADYAINTAMVEPPNLPLSRVELTVPPKVFALAGMITSIVAARTSLEHGSARDKDTDTDADADASRQVYKLLAIALTQVFWVLAVTVGKLAACLACLCLVEGLPRYSWGVRCLGGFIVTINGTTLVAQLVACPPIARPGDPCVPESCNAALYEGASWAQAIGAAASDLPLAVFPAILLRKAKMMPRTQIALSGIMCLGLA